MRIGLITMVAARHQAKQNYHPDQRRAAGIGKGTCASADCQGFEVFAAATGSRLVHLPILRVPRRLASRLAVARQTPPARLKPVGTRGADPAALPDSEGRTDRTHITIEAMRWLVLDRSVRPLRLTSEHWN